jgi:hypothetical protein
LKEDYNCDLARLYFKLLLAMLCRISGGHCLATLVYGCLLVAPGVEARYERIFSASDYLTVKAMLTIILTVVSYQVKSKVNLKRVLAIARIRREVESTS